MYNFNTPFCLFSENTPRCVGKQTKVCKKHTIVCTKTQLIFTHLDFHTFENARCVTKLTFWMKTHHDVFRNARRETQLVVFYITPCLVCCKTHLYKTRIVLYKYNVVCHDQIDTPLISIYTNVATRNIMLRFPLSGCVTNNIAKICLNIIL